MATKSHIPYGPDPGVVGRRSATIKGVSEVRDGATDLFHRDEVFVTDGRVVTYKGTGQTFAVPGNAAIGQPLFTFSNNAPAGTLYVSIRDIFVWSTAGAAAATIFHLPWATGFRTTVQPTGGTAIVKAAVDTRETSHANASGLQGASADGTGTVITAPAVSPRLLGRPTTNYSTMVGVQQMTVQDMMEGAPGDEIVLQPGQHFVVAAQAIVAGDNATTRRWWVDYSWLEFTEL